jgi:hypothetical protein
MGCEKKVVSRDKRLILPQQWTYVDYRSDHIVEYSIYRKSISLLKRKGIHLNKSLPASLSPLVILIGGGYIWRNNNKLA